MDPKKFIITKEGSESRDSIQPVVPATSGFQSPFQEPITGGPKLTTKGVENAKKRLRAFSIQKKAPITPVPVAKPLGSGNTTVLIGKLSSVKVTPKPEKVEDDPKKPPRPPKPGASKRSYQDSYTELQKKTLSEIEDMKRKMELIELGIPLGLISPCNTEKAMPTKAMPPIKTFLDSAKVDEIIREAKKAKAEGREFKFDYHKFVPDYDNPFQRKKEDTTQEKKEPDKTPDESERRRSKTDRRSVVKYVRRNEYRKEDRDKHKDKYKEKEKKDTDDKSKERDDKSKDKDDKSNKDDKDKEKETRSKTREEKKEEIRKLIEKNIDKDKETDVNLNDYLVCDSWSLDNDEKNSTSPQVDDKNKNIQKDIKAINEQIRETFIKKDQKPVDSPKIKEIKIEKLQPVMDSFKFEIDPNDDEILDIFDEDTSLEKYATATTIKDSLYDSPVHLKLDYDQDLSKDTSVDANDDTFLESVINEIKQEEMSDNESQDKGLVEYDMSPAKDDEVKDPPGSVTPELDDKVLQSQRSDYSDCKSTDSRKSVESGYKSTDTGYKSASEGYKDRSEYRSSVEKELDEALEDKMATSTVDSLETWSFVLKICQPLLFRHDKNKCYKETRTSPKLWYTENPKLCSCVKDRAVVYEELEMCKMNLVDRVYGCDQIADAHTSTARSWYPPHQQCLAETRKPVPLSSDWESEEPPAKTLRRSMTPERNEEVFLDREYQRFMQAVWPDVSEPKSKAETSRSTTPVRQESRKKKKKEDKEEEKKKVKKIKLSSEGWSQESDIEVEVVKSKKEKLAKEKTRKRKHSISISSSESEDDAKKKKNLKKKAIKQSKSKSAKRRRLGKKMLKKLKEKEKKKKKKALKVEEESDPEEEEKETKKKEKKVKKKKQQKVKKKTEKKKKVRAKSPSSSDSSSSSSSSDSESEDERTAKKAKKREAEARKKKKDKKKKRKQSTSESASDDLFDVNILNNIKTERLTDDEKHKLDQSPRKHREIINVKELQDDFSSTVQVKQEIEDEAKKASEEMMNMFEMDKEEPAEVEEKVVEEEKVEFKEPQDIPPPPSRPADESNLSQSSQESICSIKETAYEKDESHLRPSSQNSNYSFNDVITASQSGLYTKEIEEEEKFDNYEQGNYEMYEHLAMAYQSDVASQQISPPSTSGEQRIETVVCARSRGEIKCDWRATDPPALTTSHRPSRWGLKPGDVNIVLTGGSEQFPIRSVVDPEPVYRIQTVANRNDSSYDEAYMDMYGASDRLQYGDCFATEAQEQAHSAPSPAPSSERTSSLDARIDLALRSTGQYGDCFATEAQEQAHSAPSPATSAERTSSLDARIDLALRSTGQYGDCFATEAQEQAHSAPSPAPSSERTSSLDARIDLALRSTGQYGDCFATEAQEQAHSAPSPAPSSERTSSLDARIDLALRSTGQYGDCFATEAQEQAHSAPSPAPSAERTSSLDARIDLALRSTGQYGDCFATEAQEQAHSAPSPAPSSERTSSLDARIDLALRSTGQYGDCFATEAQEQAHSAPSPAPSAERTSSLDARIDLALRSTGQYGDCFATEAQEQAHSAPSPAPSSERTSSLDARIDLALRSTGQYGDCFATEAQEQAHSAPSPAPSAERTSSLDARIDLALRSTGQYGDCFATEAQEQAHSAPSPAPSSERTSSLDARIDLALRSTGQYGDCFATEAQEQAHSAPSPAPSSERTSSLDARIDLALRSTGQYGDCFATEAQEQAHSAPSPAPSAERTSSLDARIDLALRSTGQYGDCFATEAQEQAHSAPSPAPSSERTSSLDARIDLALRSTVLGEVAKDSSADADKDGPEKGILVSKSVSVSDPRGAKRVSFADGYKPGQDSDVEEPPAKKRKKLRRTGCAWPCPASHPDHVALWDALPPPPPPAGSPPPPRRAPPPLHLLRPPVPQHGQLLPPAPHALHHKFDPSASLPNFMPPEPPPGLISFP